MLSKYGLQHTQLDKKQYEEAVRHMSVPVFGEGADSHYETESSISIKQLEISPSLATQSTATFSISRLFSTKIEEPKKKLCSCCSCKCKCRSKKDEEAYVEQAFHRVASIVFEGDKSQFENITVEDFINEVLYLTRNARITYNNLLDAKSLLEYTNDPSAEALGLSQVGGFVWLVTYSIQHLVNPMTNPTNLTQKLRKIQSMFHEIAANSQRLAQTAKTLDELLAHYRECAAWVVKKTEKAFQIKDSPFLIKPEVQARVPRRGSRKKEETVLRKSSSPTDVDEQDDGLFHVQWSPLNVMVKSKPKDDFEIFASMNFNQKLLSVETFMKEALRKVNTSATDVATTTEFLVLKSITHETKLETMKSELSAIMYPTVQFLAERIKARNNKEARKKLEVVTDKDVNMISLAIQDFWLTVHGMESVGKDVRELLVETRDIVRSCYIYTTQFYHWKLTDYDEIEPSLYPKGRRQTRTAQFFARLLGTAKVSDTVLYLSLSDFTSSIYQYIVQENPIRAGQMSMMLTTFEEKPEEEPWGLLPGAFDHLDTFPRGYSPLKPKHQPKSAPKKSR